ncbi:hypothetical protein [Halolamina sp. C58]|uniref:hypothetical protein n=1 Tax=Halolamina sp. C58 TaxID=3421640 RepID=UPI003EBC4AAE
MSEHTCGGECNDGSACERPVSAADQRCPDHPRTATDGGAVVADSGPRPENQLSPEPAEDASVSLASCGDALRSFFELPSVLVRECILRFDEDGLHVRAVDPSNVGMIDVEMPGEMFGRYEVSGGDEVEFGVNLERLRKTLRWARKGRGNADGDPVTIDFLPSVRRIRVRVVREDSRMVRKSEWGTIDPDSVRDRPNIPNLDLPNRADPEIGALGDALTAVDAAGDHMELTREEETLVLSSHGNNNQGDDDERVTLLESAWDNRDADAAEPCTSIFSLDYCEDMIGAIDSADADRLTLKWGDEFPIKIAFTDEKWSISGVFMLAPRIASDGGGADD